MEMTALVDDEAIARLMHDGGADVAEASRELNVSKPTLLRMAEQGLLTVLRPTLAKKVVVPRSEIARLKRESIQWRRV